MEVVTYIIAIILALTLAITLWKYFQLKSHFRTSIKNDQTNLFDKINTLLLLYRRLYESETEGYWIIKFRKKIFLDKEPEILAEEIFDSMYFFDCNESFPHLLLLDSKKDVINKNLKDIPNISRKLLIHEIETMIRNQSIENSVQIESPFVDNNNYYTNNIFGVIENNELKEMVGILRDFNQFISVQKELFDLKYAIDKTSEGVCISDGHSKAFYVNKAFTDITGYTLDEIQNTTLTELFLDEKSKIYRSEEGIERIKYYGGSWSGKILIKAKNGAYKHLIANLTSIDYDTEPNKRFVTVFSDITNEKKLEEALVQSQKLQAMGTLTGGVAHDFSNVLTIILGNTDYLINNYDSIDKDDLLDSLQIIDRSAKQAEAQTRRLLAFSRKTDTRKKSINLDKWLSEIKPLYSQVVSKKVKLTMKLNSENAVCSIDNSLFELVLLNLVKNSTHAIERTGKIEIKSSILDYEEIDEIDRKSLEPSDYALIQVEDNGSGMSQEVQDRIFEPFYTTKEEGKGTGLGLSMAYGIVDEHDGIIKVKSELNKGTTFSIYIPVAESDRDDPPSDLIIEELNAENVYTVVIDEDVNFGKIMEKHFKSRNLNFEYAQNLNSTLSIVETIQCNNLVLVMAIDSSKTQNNQLIKELRKIKPDLKCIIIGTCNNSVTVSQIAFNCDETLCKPFSFSTLINKISSLLENTHKQIQAF